MTAETDKAYYSGVLIVAEWLNYGSADEKYRSYVRVAERRDWADSLSREDSEVFGIEVADVPALVWAHQRYENLNGEDESFFGEFREQERIDYPAFFSGELEWSFDLAAGFMASSCVLSLAKCTGWVSKVWAEKVRRGECAVNDRSYAIRYQ